MKLEEEQGNPLAEKCRCGATRSRHPEVELPPTPENEWRVLWCYACDQPKAES